MPRRLLCFHIESLSVLVWEIASLVHGAKDISDVDWSLRGRIRLLPISEKGELPPLTPWTPATASDLFGLKQSAKQYPATASSNVSNIVIFPLR